MIDVPAPLGWLVFPETVEVEALFDASNRPTWTPSLIALESTSASSPLKAHLQSSSDLTYAVAWFQEPTVPIYYLARPHAFHLLTYCLSRLKKWSKVRRANERLVSLNR